MMMLLVMFIFSTFTGHSDAGLNVALGKHVVQSTTYNRPDNVPGMTGLRNASIAVDGVPTSDQCTNINKGDGLYSHTKAVANSWWRVDLGRIYCIYRMTICNRGGPWNFRLDNVLILSSSSGDFDPSDPNKSENYWRHIYTVQMPAGDFTEAEFSAPESARHIAMFNPTNNTVTLREVTVEGFSLEDVSAIKLQGKIEDISLHEMTLRISLSSFNTSIFENSRIAIYQMYSGMKNEIQSRNITSNTADVVFLQGNLTPSTQYFYEVELSTYSYVLANQTLSATTLQNTGADITKSPEVTEAPTRQSLMSGAIVGIAVSSVVVAGFAVAIVIFFRLRKNREECVGSTTSSHTKTPSHSNEQRVYDETYLYPLAGRPESSLNYQTIPGNLLCGTEDHQYAILSSQYEVLSSARVGDDHVYAETYCRDNQQLRSVTSSSQGDSSTYANVGLKRNYENVSDIQ